MELPSWLDVPKIMGVAALVLMITQYLKDSLPAWSTRWFAILLGIGLSLGCDCYTGKSLNIIKGIIDGVVAAVMADFGYAFLSKKGGGTLSLPSRKDDPPGKADP